MINFFIQILLFVLIQPQNKEKILLPDPCGIYGSVYIEEIKRRADYVIYEESSEAFADVNIFQEDNKLLADNGGIWYFTDKREFADFTVYFDDERSNVDFSIYYTDHVTYAGCK